MPENILKKLNARIPSQWKVCFFTALAAGLLAHLYKITGWLPNWDSLVFRYDAQNMIALGRWFLPVACSFSSFYDLPLLNGLLAIFFHALSAVCICGVLGVQKRLTAALVGGITVSFPAVTSVMMYNYVADGYAIAFFLSALAAYFMTSEKPRYLLSALLIALSVGIYQAYITVAVTLVLFKLTDEILYRGTPLPRLFKKTAFMLLSGIGGMAIYGIVLKLLLAVTSTELLDYQGINSTASLSGINLAGSLYTVKETFIKTFFDTSNGVNFYVVLNALLLLLTLGFYIAQIIKSKLYKKPLSLIMLIFLAVMTVIGAGALALVNASVDYHNLMRMGYLVFYLFFLVLYERGGDSPVRCWTVLAVAVLLTANQTVIANVSYHKAQMAYERSYGVLIRIADRIEQTEGAEDCDRIAVLGALDNSEDYSVNLTPDITGITDGYVIRADDETVGQSVLCAALNDYCEKNYRFVSGDEKRAIADSEDVRAMNEWPSKDCISVIDGTVVIKLSAEVED